MMSTDSKKEKDLLPDFNELDRLIIMSWYSDQDCKCIDLKEGYNSDDEDSSNSEVDGIDDFIQNELEEINQEESN